MLMIDRSRYLTYQNSRKENTAEQGHIDVADVPKAGL
jgi:hypothetical protein